VLPKYLKNGLSLNTVTKASKVIFLGSKVVGNISISSYDFSDVLIKIISGNNILILRIIIKKYKVPSVKRFFR
jgi:hypothetical protein